MSAEQLHVQRMIRHKTVSEVLRRYRTDILLAAPVAALLLIFFAWPIVILFVRSIAGDAGHGLRFDIYWEIFQDRLLLQVFWNTVVIAFWSTLFTGLLAIPTAYLLSRLRGRLRNILFACIILPFLVSILVRLFSFTIILGPNGIIAHAFKILHLDPPSLIFNTTGTVIGMTNFLLPYMVLMLYTGMDRFNHELLTAARSLGASSWQCFRWVFLPIILPTLVSACLLVLILGLGFFLTPAILGGPGNMPIAVYIKQQIDVFQWANASAAGIVLLVVTFIGYVVVLRVSGVSALGSVTAGTGSKGGGTRPEPLPFSVSSVLLWIAMICSLIVMIFPLVVAVGSSFNSSPLILFPPHGFTLKWYAAVFQDPQWLNSIIKSVGVAAGTATLVVVLSLAFGRFLLRRKSPIVKTWLMAIAYSPLVIPLILLSIGNFAVQIKLDFIGTWWGLVFIHAVLAFPFGAAIITNALGGVDPDLEKAAWTLGAKPLRAFWIVVVRGIAPSVISAWVICFLVSWDEVVIAIFQTGFQKTLPVLIYSYIKSGLVPTVPAVATMLIGLIGVGAMANAIVTNIRKKRRLT